MKRYLLDTSIVAFLYRGKYGIGKMHIYCLLLSHFWFSLV